jgi:hypothetical protein
MNSQSLNYTQRPIAPRMYYKFSHLTADQALQHINKLTNNFAPESGIAPEFIENLHNELDTRGYTLYGFLYAPSNVEVVKQVIGKGGCYFHKTTEECSIDFLWHNREQNRFEFFGSKANLIHAMDIIRSRIEKVSAIHQGGAPYSTHVSFNNTIDRGTCSEENVPKNRNPYKKTWAKVVKKETVQ